MPERLLPAAPLSAQESGALSASSSEEAESAGPAGPSQLRRLAAPLGAVVVLGALGVGLFTAGAALDVHSTSDGSGRGPHLGQGQRRVESVEKVRADAREIIVQEANGTDEASPSVNETDAVATEDKPDDSKCGNSVCYRGATCCPDTAGGLCGSPGSVCCGTSICSPGSTCCGNGLCAAPGSTCCGDKGVCSPGSTCCPSGINGSSMCCADGFQCCPPKSGLSGCCPIKASLNNQTSCGVMKCTGGSICCKDQLCGTPQSVCCGNIVCAPGATCCGTGLCASPRSTCCGTNICGPESSCCESTTGKKMCCGPSSRCCPKDSGLKGCCPREVFPTGWEGNYSDPNHPGCKREITQDGLDLNISGTDGDPGCNVSNPGTPWTPLSASLASPESQEIVIDFSPKGGPEGLVGKWDGSGIRFADGNRWTKLGMTTVGNGSP